MKQWPIKHVKRSLVASLFATLITLLLLSAQVVQAAPLSSWSVVPSPNVEPGENYLKSVAVISASNTWAVGSYYSLNNVYQTLIEHWNGTSWSVVSSPNIGTGDNNLAGVAAVSASNIWTVGFYYDSVAGINKTLIEHWNGTKWKVVSSPNPGNLDNRLLGVKAISASNIWAVGYSNPKDLIEHWNGTSWSVVSSPNSQGGTLQGVAAVSASNIWAVGIYYNINMIRQTLIEHWNGTSWSMVSSPNIGTGDNNLAGVAAFSASNIWAVGDYVNGSVHQTLIERWNGTKWKVVSSPNPTSSQGSFLNSVAAVSASNIWAVGEYTNGSAYQTLIEQWNGTSWSVVSSPSPGSSNNQLYGVERVPGSINIWAVGEYTNPPTMTLTEFYS